MSPTPNYTDRQCRSGKGRQFKADTLEDLLTQCGFEGDALDNALAVERYNEAGKAGSDDDFGKHRRMFALENPRTMHASGAPLPCWCAWAAWRATRTATPSPRRTPPAPSATSSRACMSAAMWGSRYAVEYPICMRGISLPVRLLRLHRRQELRGRCLMPIADRTLK